MREVPIDKIMVEAKPVSKREIFFQLEYLVKQNNFDSALKLIQTNNITKDEIVHLKDVNGFLKALED